MMRRQRGFSLIELLISMVIGLVVIGAMMAAYLGSGLSSRNSRAMAQITEDASVALNVLRTQISMAGYANPVGIGADGKFTYAAGFGGQSVVGCDGKFEDVDKGFGDLDCGEDNGSDSIAVRYQADAFNSVVGAGGNPLDCLGNGIGADASGNWTAYSRFFVSNGELMCRGDAVGAQALVDNVQSMQVTYGIAGIGDNEFRTVRYASAADSDFTKVISVRVCVVIRSADEVMDSTTPYRNCAGENEDPGDRRMYRAFTTTIVLQSSLGGDRK